MPVLMHDFNILQAYARNVVANARHHANHVEEVIAVLIGAVVLCQDFAVPLQIRRAIAKPMGNVITLTIRGARYVLSYDHAGKAIVLKAGSLTGPPLHRFTNATPAAEVLAIFADLASSSSSSP